MKALVAAGIFAGIAAARPRGQVSHRRQTATSHPPPTVNVKNGTISGVHSTTYNEDYFLGVPFAQPPLGPLRFRVPQGLNTTFDGTYDATEYAPMCFGYGSDQVGYPRAEDCLYLNVVRPAGYENQSLPVGVWIYGGGLYDGGSRDERYNLSFIVQNSVEIGKPIIGVSIAYRLAAWGFLASQEVSGSGNTNLGLRDQRLALHWINENIPAFGGDPSKVTIWGESAGAESVGFQLTAYNGRDDGIFRAGIMQSGNPVAYASYRTNLDYQPKYDSLLNATNCSTAYDTLGCLREIPSDTLDTFFKFSELASGWSPIVDGDFVQRWASIQLAEGAFVKVPIIDGTSTDEGASFGPRGINTTADFAATLTDPTANVNLPERYVDEVLAAYPDTPAYWVPPVEEIGNYTYPASYGAQYRRSAGYWGDAIFNANRRGAVETWAANGVPAYSYRFNTLPAGITLQAGVGHFQEVAFAFDNTLGVGYGEEHGSVKPFANKTKSFYDLAELMSKSWASFIYALDPNYEEGRIADAPLWPQYRLDQPENIVWDANVTGVAFNEPDTWRAEGIRWILAHALAYRR